MVISRYSRPEMAEIWSEENKYKAWLEVEILADEAWAELGEIPAADVKKIRENATFNVERILEIEKETRHDVVAFTRSVSESLGEERKWVHYGLTSTDVVDTAYGYLYKQANDILRNDLKNFAEIVKNKENDNIVFFLAIADSDAAEIMQEYSIKKINSKSCFENFQKEMKIFDEVV